MYTNISGRPLDSPEFYPFYEMAEKYDIPIHLHPTHPPAQGQRKYELEYKLPIIFGWPFEISIAIGRIVFSGLLEKFPNLKIITHHLGGMIPFLEARIDGVSEEGMEEIVDKRILSKKPMEYFKKIYYDTATCGSMPALECAHKVIGPDQILFGADYPFGPEDAEKWVRQTLHSIQNSELPNDSKNKILGENANRLFRQ